MLVEQGQFFTYMIENTSPAISGTDKQSKFQALFIWDSHAWSERKGESQDNHKLILIGIFVVLIKLLLYVELFISNPKTPLIFNAGLSLN